MTSNQAQEITLDADSADYIRTVSESGQAFGKAIDAGILTDHDEDAHDYAGRYMYMGVQQGRLQFKNIITRQYISCRA
jgi:hypothetical protein